MKKTSLSTTKPQADNDFVHSWMCYRTLRGVVLGMFVAAMVEVRFIAPGIAIAATFFLYFLLAMWLANWNCPRCKRPFFRYAFLRSLFGARCFYCRLPKWAVTTSGDMLLRPKFPLGWRTEVVDAKEEKK